MLFCYGESIMAEEFKKTGLMDGMGENDEIERWITVKGNHIPIKKGQTPKQAIEQAFDKPKNFINIQLFGNNFRNMGVIQLKKSIRSFEKQIKIHDEKIKNNPNSVDVEHWRREIEVFKQNIKKCEDEIKERGIENEI
jgi:hypothetical protein